MELHESLFAIGAIIVVAKLIEGIFKRFGLNSIVAYVAAGILLGPLTGVVETSKEIEFVLSISIFIFFFLIGLEELDIGGFISAYAGVDYSSHPYSAWRYRCSSHLLSRPILSSN